MDQNRNMAVNLLEAVINGEDCGNIGHADILISVNIDDGQAAKYHRLGIPLVVRTLAEQEELNRLSEELKKGKDNYRLGRVSQEGSVRIADSGNLRWGKDGRKFLYPWTALDDLLVLGYKIVVLEVFKREGDKNAKFRIGLSDRAEAVAVKADKQWAAAIKEVVKKLYYQGWVYYNEQIASLTPETDPMQAPLVTVNLVGPINDKKRLNEVADQIREIHVGFGGSLTTSAVGSSAK